MPTLTDRDKRTLRIALAGILIYLALFYGLVGWKRLETSRSEYLKLLKDAQRLRQELQPYEIRALQGQKLKETLRLDPSKLSKASLVADASAAIQRAAQVGGIKLGPIRESPARASAKELTSMQIEGTGPVPAVAALFHRLETLGYPLIVESVQITPDNTKPGMVKLSLTIIILDFEQWKSEEVRNV